MYRVFGKMEDSEYRVGIIKKDIFLNFPPIRGLVEKILLLQGSFTGEIKILLQMSKNVKCFRRKIDFDRGPGRSTNFILSGG